MLISRQAQNEFLDRDCDDHRWVKKMRRAGFQKMWSGWRTRPAFKTDPWIHQQACFQLGVTHPDFSFLLGMGAGKTKLSYDIMSHRFRRGQVERALVCTPRAIVTGGWETAAAIHSNLHASPVLVPNLGAKWELIGHPAADVEVVVVDYQSLVLATTKQGKVRRGLKWVKGLVPDADKIDRITQLYNLLVLDEIHFLRNISSLWYSVVSQIAAGMDYRYGLTGTLFGHNPEEAWGPCHLIDGGESLGETLGLFRAVMCNAKTDPWAGVTYEFRKDRQRDFARMLRHRSITYVENEFAELPERVEREVRTDMGHDVREHYLRAVQGIIDAGGAKQELDAQWIRMRQLCAGYLGWRDDAGEHLLEFAAPPKEEHLVALVESAVASGKVVVAYDYTTTAKRVHARLTKEGHKLAWIYGGCKDPNAEKRRFIADPEVKVLLLNSVAGGTGTDGLQEVANCLIFYEAPPSPIVREQTIKRVHRPGSASRVTVFDLITKGSVESDIVKDAKEGRDLYARVMGGGGANFLPKSIVY